MNNNRTILIVVLLLLLQLHWNTAITDQQQQQQQWPQSWNMTMTTAPAATPTTTTTFTFTQELLQLTHTAVHLSSLAYDNDPLYGDIPSSYKSIDVFQENVDQAILVKIDDYCVVAFRGTELSSWYDMYQNIIVGNEPICDSATNSMCCNAERGFYDAYNREYRTELENKIRFCSSQCVVIQNEDNHEFVTKCPTVVLTGHSQGGSIATIAAVALSDLTPIVITFGQPPTIDVGCVYLDGNRIYRFENSRVGRRGTTYDPVPYLPYPASQYGHQIMLGDDMTRVAYIGQTTTSGGIEFDPWDSGNFFATHRLSAEYVGYMYRIDSLVSANINVAIVPSSGFNDGTGCSNDMECDSQICYAERCVRA